MAELCSVLVDFLDCCIHSLLYSREVYPAEFFVRRMQYGVCVWRCSHPEVLRYVDHVLCNILVLMQEVDHPSPIPPPSFPYC